MDRELRELERLLRAAQAQEQLHLDDDMHQRLHVARLRAGRPVFEHYCGECAFLGTFEGVSGSKSCFPPLEDWYYCSGPAASLDGSCIARYGCWVGEYASAPVGVLLPYLNEWRHERVQPRMLAVYHEAVRQGLV